MSEQVRSRGMPPCPCPVCGKRLNRAMGTGVPCVGDLSICLVCRTPLVITRDGYCKMPHRRWRELIRAEAPMADVVVDLLDGFTMEQIGARSARASKKETER